MLRNRKRYLVYGGMFGLMFVSYLDRVNLSVAAGPIAKAYGLDPIVIGYLLSAYLWTYLVFLIPLGMLVDRWGARRVTAGSMAIWSVGGALTGWSPGSRDGLTCGATRCASRRGPGRATTWSVGGR